MQRHLAVVPSEHDVDQINRDLIAEFAMRMDVAPSTRAKYRAQLEEFRVWLAHPGGGGGRPSRLLTDADAGDVHCFMAYLRTDDRFAASMPAGSRALSASSRKSCLASLRGFFRYAVIVRLMPSDPSAGVRTPRVSHTPGLHLTVEQMHLLLNARGGARERIVTHLLAYTGARAGELRSLQWHDIDFRERSVTLHGKGGKVRVLALHPRLVSELRLWLVAQERQAERCPAIRDARASRDTDFVLLTRNGRQLGVNAIAKQLKRRAARAGIYALEPAHGEHRSHVSPHALRRTFATLLLNSGEPLDAIADIFGHTSVDTTRRHYAFSSAARTRATIESLPL